VWGGQGVLLCTPSLLCCCKNCEPCVLLRCAVASLLPDEERSRSSGVSAEACGRRQPCPGRAPRCRYQPPKHQADPPLARRGDRPRDFGVPGFWVLPQPATALPQQAQQAHCTASTTTFSAGSREAPASPTQRRTHAICFPPEEEGGQVAVPAAAPTSPHILLFLHLSHLFVGVHRGQPRLRGQGCCARNQTPRRRELNTLNHATHRRQRRRQGAGGGQGGERASSRPRRPGCARPRVSQTVFHVHQQQGPHAHARMRHQLTKPTRLPCSQHQTLSDDFLMYSYK
jgi:hypothetical protein